MFISLFSSMLGIFTCLGGSVAGNNYSPSPYTTIDILTYDNVEREGVALNVSTDSVDVINNTIAYMDSLYSFYQYNDALLGMRYYKAHYGIYAPSTNNEIGYIDFYLTYDNDASAYIFHYEQGHNGGVNYDTFNLKTFVNFQFQYASGVNPIPSLQYDLDYYHGSKEGVYNRFRAGELQLPNTFTNLLISYLYFDVTFSPVTQKEYDSAVGNFTPEQIDYDNGYEDGYQDGYDVGESNGYQQGLRDGADEDYSFWALFGAVADTPILIVRNLLDFDLFGVSALTAVMSLFTALLLIFIARKLLK